MDKREIWGRVVPENYDENGRASSFSIVTLSGGEIEVMCNDISVGLSRYQGHFVTIQGRVRSFSSGRVQIWPLQICPRDFEITELNFDHAS